MSGMALIRLARMLRLARMSLPLALVLAALGLAACGDDDGTIPPDRADALEAALEDVEAAVESADCTTARTDVTQLKDAVDQLPKDVGVETKGQLRELVNNLADLVDETCEEPDPPPDTGATGFGGSD